jgi:hypothetical protein
VAGIIVKAINSNLALSSYLFGVSGSGKTRLSLDGLCQKWGLYISCRTKQGPASGSDDFNVATEMLLSMSTWHQGTSSADISKNAEAAHRAFAILLCARVFILKQLVQHIPVGTDVIVARRRWILAQVVPPRLKFEDDDLFVKLLRDLWCGDTKIMLCIVCSTLLDLTTNRQDLFPLGSDTPLSVVIDEAQVAADDLQWFKMRWVMFPQTRWTRGYIPESSLMLGVSRGTVLLKWSIFAGTSFYPMMTSQIGDYWSAWCTGFLARSMSITLQDSFSSLIQLPPDGEPYCAFSLLGKCLAPPCPHFVR